LYSVAPRALGPVFIYCVSGLSFGCTEGVGSRFHILRSQTCFRRCRVCRVSLSCFARPDLFSAVPRARGTVLMFCVPGLVFGGTDGIGSHFHVLRALTHFPRNQGRRVPFSCFERPDSFSAAPRASGPVDKFCAPGLVFDGTEGVGSRFHVLRSRNHFRRYRGRQVPFSCFARPESFSAVSRASGPVVMFCAPGLVFGGAGCVRSSFHVLRTRTGFRLFRGRQVSFSCFARFCAPGIIFDGTEGVGSRSHVLRAWTRFR
jgi:hypothetical protein